MRDPGGRLLRSVDRRELFRLEAAAFFRFRHILL